MFFVVFQLRRENPFSENDPEEGHYESRDQQRENQKHAAMPEARICHRRRNPIRIAKCARYSYCRGHAEKAESLGVFFRSHQLAVAGWALKRLGGVDTDVRYCVAARRTLGHS